MLFVVGAVDPPPASSAPRHGVGRDRAARASRAMTVIDAQLEHCLYAADGNPTEIQVCHSKAIDRFDALLRPPRNKRLDAFRPDLLESLYFYLAKGDDASSLKVVASASHVDLARKRAAILSGAGTRRWGPPRNWSSSCFPICRRPLERSRST